MATAYREFRETDIPAIVQIANIIEEQRNDPGRTTEERIRQLLAAPYVFAEDFSTAVDADGRVIGASVMMMMRPDNGMMIGDVILHPDYHESPVTGELVQQCEASALKRAEKRLPDEAVVHLNLGVQDYRGYLRNVAEAAGYVEVRRQYIMRIALDAPVEQPVFPPEFEFRAFDRERDATAVHAAFQESFADHWGGVEHIPYEQWAHQFENPLFDPTLWYALYHEDKIVAICLCELSTREKTLGLVEALGVLPPYRKRGLGAMLLRHAFHEFQRRGYQHVSLGVDAQSKTNAVALYERAGMSVHRCVIIYRKVLRGNAEEIED